MLVPLLVALCHCGFSQHQRRTKYHRYVVLKYHLVPEFFYQVPQACCSYTTYHSYFTKYHRQPHVVLILADDLGFNDVPWHNPTMQVRNMCLLGCCGKKPLDTLKGIQDKSLQAPTMASLAKQGVVLEQNYVQPKCAPSRAALMTGDP